MVRVVLVGATAAAALAAGGSPASAGPTRKVTIETTPPGAQVYLNAKEDGPVCTATPCTIDAPIGDTPMIVELENHVSEITQLSVPRRGKVDAVEITLSPAIGTIYVDGPVGATILIDGVDKGKAPSKLEIEAGPHMIVLTLRGKQVFSDPVVIANGDETRVSGVAQAGDGGDDGDGELPGGGVTKRTEPPPRRTAPIISAELMMNVGFRRFTYERPLTDNLADSNEAGQVLLGPVIQLWPGTLFGVPALRGLSLVGRAGIGVNSLTVLDANRQPTTASTFWRSYEVSARHRWTFADLLGIELGAGWVRDQYQFSGQLTDILRVPDADYRALRLGVRASVLLGAAEPYLAAENRIVMSGGTIEQRFGSAAASGMLGAAGLALTFGPVQARVEASLCRYTWTFKADSSADMFRADGGADTITQLTAALAYAY